MTLAIDPGRSQEEILAGGEFPLMRKDLVEIAAMIYSDAGIYLNETKASLVYSRLSKHIRQLGLKDFRSYCELVSSTAGATERREMLSFLTTNFTRFSGKITISITCQHRSPAGIDRTAEGWRARANLVGCVVGRPGALFDRADGPVGHGKHRRL